MPDAGLLDTLVKLAGLGTSGISIFVVFWIGWLIWKPVTKRSAQQERTLREFMIVCVIIAIISAGTAMLGNTRENNSLRDEANSLRNQIDFLQKQAEERNKSYSVEGTIEMDDRHDDPGVVIITTNVPPLMPHRGDGFFHFDVWKDANGRLPGLSLTCPGYALERFDLNDQASKTATGKIELSRVVMHRIPER